jgi:Fungal Zn(2)-Cys(6) binuclear cluster domain
MTWAPFSFKVTRTFKTRLPTTLERNTPFFVSCQFVYVAPKTHQEAPSMLTYHHLAHQPPNCSTAQAVESASYNEVGRPNHIPQPAFQSSLQIQPGVQQRLSPPLHQSLSPNQPPPSPQPRQPSSPQKTSPSLNQQLPNPRKTQPTSPQSSPQTEPPPLSTCCSYFSAKPPISFASPISLPIKPRKKGTSLACQHCRKRKVKCGGEHPCIRCTKGGKECIYPQRIRLVFEVYIMSRFLHNIGSAFPLARKSYAPGHLQPSFMNLNLSKS